jgi:ketosteroid isomerase-like protein
VDAGAHRRVLNAIIAQVAESNAQLVRHGFEGLARGDFVALTDLLAPDVKWHGGDPSSPDGCHDRDQVLALIRRAWKMGAIGELVDVIDGTRGRVVVILGVPGEPDGPARTVANMTTFRGGQVVEMQHFADPDDALQAAGV